VERPFTLPLERLMSNYRAERLGSPHHRGCQEPTISKFSENMPSESSQKPLQRMRAIEHIRRLVLLPSVKLDRPMTCSSITVNIDDKNSRDKLCHGLDRAEQYRSPPSRRRQGPLSRPKRDRCRLTDDRLDQRDGSKIAIKTLYHSTRPDGGKARAIGQQVLHAGTPALCPQAKTRLDIDEVRALQRLTQIAVIEDEYMARDVQRAPNNPSVRQSVFLPH
jgi:hypothetical protein